MWVFLCAGGPTPPAWLVGSDGDKNALPCCRVPPFLKSNWIKRETCRIQREKNMRQETLWILVHRFQHIALLSKLWQSNRPKWKECKEGISFRELCRKNVCMNLVCQWTIWDIISFTNEWVSFHKRLIHFMLLGIGIGFLPWVVQLFLATTYLVIGGIKTLIPGCPAWQPHFKIIGWPCIGSYLSCQWKSSSTVLINVDPGRGP